MRETTLTLARIHHVDCAGFALTSVVATVNVFDAPAGYSLPRRTYCDCDPCAFTWRPRLTPRASRASHVRLSASGRLTRYSIVKDQVATCLSRLPSLRASLPAFLMTWVNAGYVPNCLISYHIEMINTYSLLRGTTYPHLHVSGKLGNI